MSAEERDARQGRPVLEWMEPPVWDVIDDGCAFLGTLSLPEGASPVAARGSKVWAIVRGAMDESYLVRYGIRSGG